MLGIVLSDDGTRFKYLVCGLQCVWFPKFKSEENRKFDCDVFGANSLIHPQTAVSLVCVDGSAGTLCCLVWRTCWNVKTIHRASVTMTVMWRVLKSGSGAGSSDTVNFTSLTNVHRTSCLCLTRLPGTAGPQVLSAGGGLKERGQRD